MRNFTTSNGALTVNLSALATNYQLLKNKVGTHCAVAGIVKANAYGLGLQDISSKLNTLNCPQFFVATLNEALELRSYDPTTPIAVLGGVMPKEEGNYLNHHITPVLNSPIDIENWQNFAFKKEQTLPAIIHLDTGMNRLGLHRSEMLKLIDKPDSFKGLDIKTVMSHFVAADKNSLPLTSEQAALFSQIAQHFQTANKSLANSSGLFRDKAYHHNMVRPGYALYGGNPTPEGINPMSRVVSLDTQILQIRECKKGESIGYNATHKFDKDTRTATLAIGYADGLLRSGSSKTTLYYNNQPCPVLGRVSMDLVSIDISRIKDKQPQQGDVVEILGANQTIDDLAEATGTIGYEILTSLGNRYKREYID